MLEMSRVMEDCSIQMGIPRESRKFSGHLYVGRIFFSNAQWFVMWKVGYLLVMCNKDGAL